MKRARINLKTKVMMKRARINLKTKVMMKRAIVCKMLQVYRYNCLEVMLRIKT